MSKLNDFGSITKARLAGYKEVKIPSLKNGIWKINKQQYPHILPKENKFDNLLPIYKDKLFEYLKIQNIKLHSDFHHLNSSQAMCFNFFYPLYYERKLEIVTDFLGLKNETINYSNVCFEKEGLEAEFGRIATSFDFYFETNSGKRLYFEIKYTETEFGKSKINKDKFDRVYSKFLKPINISFHNAKLFYDNYQILRNLIHITENSFIVFIYPKDNIGIRNGANRVKRDYLNTDYHENFFDITWENIFSKIYSSTTNTKLKNQLDDFGNKYIPQ